MTNALPEHETHLRVTSSQKPMRLFLEPWGRVYVVNPGVEFTLVFHSTIPADPAVSIVDGGVEVWAWTGATVDVFQDDVELTTQKDAI